MKKMLFLSLMLLGWWSLLFAQNQAAPIEVTRAGLGPVFKQNGQVLAPVALVNLTQSNPEAYKEMKAAKGNNDIATAFGMAGGALIGWPLGSAIGGGNPNWALAGIGAGLVAVSIPFSSAYSKRAKNAVRMYNEGSPQTNIRPLDVKLRAAGNGLGLQLTF